ncbi:MAG TPA: multidrug efflux RND transporter permease subunit [Thermodesulfobacteriota bacterium]
MARFFIDRPVFAMVVAIVITLAGLIALIAGLPIAQYPQITLPSVRTSGAYVGAGAQIVEEAVAQPIETQVNGVEGMLYMRSTSTSDGYYTLTVTFTLETDPDIAAVQVQNRVSQASGSLPQEVLDAGLTTTKTTPDTVMYVALHSPNGTYDQLFLQNFANITVIEPLKRVPGAGNITLYGADFGMRLWLRPDAMARLRITPTDVLQAVRDQNVQAPAGSIGQYPVPEGQAFQYTVRVRGTLATEEEFGNIVVRAGPDGSIVRIRDIARVELGAEEYRFVSTYNGRPAANFAVSLTPDANAIETAGRLRAELARMAPGFPADVAYDVVVDNTVFVTESLEEILRTFFEALALVVLVVLVFLQTWRATLIPLVAVPVSLIGTFVSFTVLDFSVNTLTLFGMVLVIGIVVDDAIVVVEAVEHHIQDTGLDPRSATYRAMEEVQGPVVAIALVLASVFVPVAFLGGVVGQLYRQFALTVAVSVLLSALVALTLTPALCALLLEPPAEGRRRGLLGRLGAGFNRGFARTVERYGRTVALAIRRAGVVVAALVVLGAAALGLTRAVPGGFVPEEDQGIVIGTILLPEAASLVRTRDAAARVDEAIRGIPGVARTITVSGANILTGAAQSNSGLVAVALEPWGERPDVQAIIAAIRASAAEIPEAVVLAFNPPPIPGLGVTGGFSFMLEDRTGQAPEALQAAVARVVSAAQQRPEIGSVLSSFAADTPGYRFDVDRDKAQTLGVPVSDVFQALQTFLGGVRINDFTRFGRTYDVVMQAEGRYRRDVRDIQSFFVRNADGQMVPLTTLVTPVRESGPIVMTRYNAYRAAEITGTAAPGYSSGQAMQAMEEVAASVLPSGFGYEWSGLSLQEQQSAGQAPVVFGLALLFVFLFLAALYESWAVPFAVLLGVPLGVFGAFAAVWLAGYANTVYAQIGLILLIGLAAKNAILIVEFAKVRRDRGMPIVQAAVEAARLRLRPIIMTSLAFILGVVPLAVATGAGAAARNVMGVTVLGGMTAATVLGIVVIPVLFVLVQRVAERIAGPPGERAAGEGPAAGAR